MGRRDDFDDEAESFLDSILKRKGQEPMPPSMARLLMIVAGLAVVATIIAVAAATWPSKSGAGDDENSLPIVRADEAPYRIKPDEPGGMEVPNKNSTIFESMASNNDQPKKIENLLEDNEEPVNKEEAFDADAKANPVAEPEPKLAAEVEGMPEQKEMPAAETKAEPATAVDGTDEAEESVTVDAKPEKKNGDVISALKSEVGTSKARPVGSKYIQFAATTSEADAKAKCTSLWNKHTVLKPLACRIQKADLGAKGTFYRVQAGPLEASDAQSTCAAIKSAKSDCLVVK